MVAILADFADENAMAAYIGYLGVSLWSTHFKGPKKGANLDLINPHTTRCSLKHH